MAGEVLTAADLVGEYANIYDNGQALGNPWTTHQAAGGFDLTGMDEVAFTDAAAGASAAGRLRRNATSLTYHDGTAARSVLLSTDDAAVVWTNGLTVAGVTLSAASHLIPAAVSGTPTAHALYRENVVKGWVKCDFAGNISDSFNVSSITDGGQGIVTVTWDRDFASAHYAVAPGVLWAGSGIRVPHVTSQLAGSCVIEVSETAGDPEDATNLYVQAIGDQA